VGLLNRFLILKEQQPWPLPATVSFVVPKAQRRMSKNEFNWNKSHLKRQEEKIIKQRKSWAGKNNRNGKLDSSAEKKKK